MRWKIKVRPERLKLLLSSLLSSKDCKNTATRALKQTTAALYTCALILFCFFSGENFEMIPKKLSPLLFFCKPIQQQTYRPTQIFHPPHPKIQGIISKILNSLKIFWIFPDER